MLVAAAALFEEPQESATTENLHIGLRRNLPNGLMILAANHFPETERAPGSQETSAAPSARSAMENQVRSMKLLVAAAALPNVPQESVTAGETASTRPHEALDNPLLP